MEVDQAYTEERFLCHEETSWAGTPTEKLEDECQEGAGEER
jgi:hypothetical protein